MNTNLQVFQFETNIIRTVELESVVYFGARDVALALEYANPAEAYKTHCKSLKLLSYSELLQLGWNNPNPRGEYVMPEADVFRMIMKSNKSQAEKFQDWVVEEVLPSIRKTGQYQVPQMQPVALTQHDLATRQLKNEMEVWTLFECPLHIAQQEIVKLVRKDTGVDFSAALKYAKAQQNILQHEVMLEPTELGLRLGLNARQINRVLEDLGLQYKINGVWSPTDRGEKICQQHAWVSGNKSGYNLKWNLKAIEELLED